MPRKYFTNSNNVYNGKDFKKDWKILRKQENYIRSKCTL
jgi:hypothetical protein